jgi:hypothetical protein
MKLRGEQEEEEDGDMWFDLAIVAAFLIIVALLVGTVPYVLWR